MVTLRRPLAIILTLAALITSSCKDSAEDKIGHNELSQQETDASIAIAFGNETTGTLTEIPPEINEFFKKLGQASRSEKKTKPNEFFSADAMLSAVLSTGSSDSLSAREKKQFKKSFRTTIKTYADPWVKQVAYDDYKITLIEKINDDQNIVYLRQYDNEYQVVHLFRWWIVKTEKGWRIYDYEDLSIGLRTISLMGQAYKNEFSSNKKPWVQDLATLNNLLRATDLTDREQYLALEAPLEKLKSTPLPLNIKSYASMLTQTILTLKEDHEGALAEILAAEEGNYGYPLFHYLHGASLLALGRNQEALESFQKFTEKFGNDSDTLELVSDAHYGLGEFKKARQAALAGLTDNPNSANCLACLSVTMTAEEITTPEAIERFTKMKNSESAFEISLDYLIAEEKEDIALNLFKVFKKEHPESELKEYYKDLLE